ncbi:MAG: hypothetical protein ACI9FN_000255, partial [Saprospiraceae bacterium]
RHRDNRIDQISVGPLDATFSKSEKKFVIAIYP